MSLAIKQLFELFKLRIGIVIAVTALAGWAVTPGPALAPWQVAVLALTVLVASAAAGAFNQYVERDLDVLMARTRNRPFATGAFGCGSLWVALIGAMLASSVLAAGYALNPLTALYVFLGAFFYAVVYTVWLKRRTWLNIVIGGLAGSFAVLAGAAAAASEPSPLPLILAGVLFLWTPPHFWSLAIAYHDDYARARVPMLPVVIGDERAARVILANTVLLVAVSWLPAFYGAGWIYLAGAGVGGLYFIAQSLKLARKPSRKTALANFHASLAQLCLLLLAAMADAGLR